MKVILIALTVCSAMARPDVHRGYNYEKGYNYGLPGLHGFTETSSAGTQHHRLEHEVNQEEPLITKHFYLHTAPQDHDVAKKTKHFVLGRRQKNYRVVFIKAPSSNSANVELSAEYAPQEEKTVIYVLSQKEPEVSVNEIATPAPTLPSKPDVFFIKYKTPEEAAYAQEKIQAQYDALGGTSQVSDEGVLPVSSVVGVNPTNPHQSYVYPQPPTNSKYLPS